MKIKVLLAVCFIFGPAQATFLNKNDIPRCSSSDGHNKPGDLAGILGKIIKILRGETSFQPETRPLGYRPPAYYSMQQYGAPVQQYFAPHVAQLVAPRQSYGPPQPSYGPPSNSYEPAGFYNSKGFSQGGSSFGGSSQGVILTSDQDGALFNSGGPELRFGKIIGESLSKVNPDDNLGNAP